MKNNKFLAILLVLCLVVSVGCSAPTISAEQIQLIEGQTYQLTTSYQVGQWESSDTNVATVQDGVVTAVAKGVATITAKGDGNCSCVVTVTADKLTLSNSAIRIGENSTFKLTATTLSGIAPTFTSQDPNIVTVSAEGTITAVGVGATKVTAKVGSQTEQCAITVVKGVQNFSATAQNPTLAVGQSTIVDTSMMAYNSAVNTYIAIKGGFEYQSSDTNVATVDESGKITAIAQGSATITVTHPDYNASCQCDVTIVDEIASFDYKNTQHLNIYGRTKLTTYGGKQAWELVNTASAFELNFGGSEIAVNIASTGSWTHHYLRVFVDGKDLGKVKVEKNSAYQNVMLASGLNDGVHTLIAYKVHEEAQNTMYIGGFSGVTGYYFPNEKSKLTIDFYGDSITAGWSASTASDAGNSADTSDGTKTYAFVASQLLNAQMNVICMSGISLAVPMWNNTQFIKNCYNKYSIASSTVWPFENLANVIVINIGTNDGEGIANNKGTLDSFVTAYKQLIANLRQSNKDAHIICIYGMMAYGNRVADSIKTMVTELSQTDKKIYSLQLGKADNGHPGSATHASAGQALANFILSLDAK